MSALLSEKPLVCPSIEPFTSFIENYKCGETFISNDSVDLANAINKISRNINLYETQTKLALPEFVKSIIKWEDIIKFHAI